MVSVKPVRPPHLFPPIKFKDGRPDWKFTELPIKKQVMEIDAQGSQSLQRAMSTDMSEQFVKTLYTKATNKPPENIIIEVKGETRSGKSSLAFFLGKLISYWWGHEFTVDNILPNQSEFNEWVKTAKYGETVVIDEQIQEVYGEGTEREHAQLSMILNICAKRCINSIFIYPPSFLGRNAPFGLETYAKDTQNKYIKAWYHDLSKKGFGYGGIYPRGFVILPKYIDNDYKNLPRGKWSKARLKNFQERGYDFDSKLEEEYEVLKKDKWIDDIAQSLDTSRKEREKLGIAEELAMDEIFSHLSSLGKKKAYVQMKIARGECMGLTMGEIETIINMASILDNGE